MGLARRAANKHVILREYRKPRGEGGINIPLALDHQVDSDISDMPSYAFTVPYDTVSSHLYKYSLSLDLNSSIKHIRIAQKPFSDNNFSIAGL